MLAWLGVQTFSSGLARALGWGTAGGSSVGDDSLSIHRSTIRPISSGWIKSCTELINRPLSVITSTPARIPLQNVFQPFQMVSLSILSLLCQSFSAFSWFSFSILPPHFLERLLFDLSPQLSFVSPPSSPALRPSVLVITARSLKVWPGRYMSCAFLFCSSPGLQCQRAFLQFGRLLLLQSLISSSRFFSSSLWLRTVIVMDRAFGDRKKAA